jgi:outer membrane protein TolC
LALQLVALAEKTYGQQLLRFEEGIASAASVRDAHNQWQETQMSLLDEHTQWLQNRLH